MFSRAGPIMIETALPKLILRSNKKISVFPVTGLKILGRVDTQLFFPENPEKNSRFHQRILGGLGYPKHRYFFYLASFDTEHTQEISCQYFFAGKPNLITFGMILYEKYQQN